MSVDRIKVGDILTVGPMATRYRVISNDGDEIGLEPVDKTKSGTAARNADIAKHCRIVGDTAIYP
jgi:hypothetical protein